MLTFDMFFGGILGFIQGYLTIPTFALARFFARDAIGPWKGYRLALFSGFTLLCAIVFLYALHIGIALSFMAQMLDQLQFRKGWLTGGAIGICCFAVFPSLEAKLKGKK